MHKPRIMDNIEYKPSIVGSHYRVIKKIGAGSFGIIYEGISTNNNQRVAIKFEERKRNSTQLRDEYRSYKLLRGCAGISNVYYYGQEAAYNVIVLELLGPSIEQLFVMKLRRLSIKTVSMLAKQMITLLQTIHDKSLVYRDIKPENFLIGRNDKINKIYLVDFGMAKLYRNPKTKLHVPYKEKKVLSGTARYMSINTHLGREQSRRDDLESLGHVLFYPLRGSLPWQGLRATNNREKYEKIGQKKRSIPIQELCDGYPQEFGIYLTYARQLNFDETPDYDYLRGLFDTILSNINEVDDCVFDWNIPNKDSNELISVASKNSVLKNDTEAQEQIGELQPTKASENNNYNATIKDVEEGLAQTNKASTIKSAFLRLFCCCRQK